MHAQRKNNIYCGINGLNIDISSATYVYLDSDWHGEPHRFSFNRLYLITKGSGNITVNGEHIELLPGNIYFIPAGCNFSYFCEEYLEKLYFHINIRCIGRNDFFEPLQHCVILKDKEDLINTMQLLFECSDAASVMKIRSSIYALLAEISETYSLHRSNTYSPVVLQALNYIEDHYIERPSESVIASALFVSASHLRKVFKTEVGQAVGKYLAGRILSAAEKALRTTTDSINDISIRYGFYDQFYFSRVFLQKYGISPSRYRKLVRMESHN